VRPLNTIRIRRNLIQDIRVKWLWIWLLTNTHVGIEQEYTLLDGNDKNKPLVGLREAFLALRDPTIVVSVPTECLVETL